GLLAVASRVEVHHRDARRADGAEQLLIARPGLVHAARGRDHDDVGVPATGDAHEALEDVAIVLLVLGAADRNDPAARLAVGNFARHPVLLLRASGLEAAAAHGHAVAQVHRATNDDR